MGIDLQCIHVSGVLIGNLQNKELVVYEHVQWVLFLPSP